MGVILLFLWLPLCLVADFKPTACITNPFPDYSFIHSVAFHPHKNLFCATFTHANSVIFYSLDGDGTTQTGSGSQKP